jgi:hypothetical protein
MKKLLVCFLAVSLVSAYSAFSQGKFLKNVAKDVKGDILGSSGSGKKSVQPEPPCACNPAEEVFGLAKYNLVYSEVTIDVLDDGSFLVMDRLSQKYYIFKDGSQKGPYSEEDPAVAPYLGNSGTDESPAVQKYKQYISKAGEKYLIKFGGKSYGPYARVDAFAVTKSGDKFAATVVENIAVTDDEGKKMDEAIKKAKTQQEKMDLAMQYSQQMSQKMMAAGGAAGISAKLVTNIQGASFNPMTAAGYTADMKYDDILYLKFADIVDLKGNKIISMKQQDMGYKNVFVNTSNTVYAIYRDGTLTMSDGKSLTELFSPQLMRAEGKTYLAYLYYSPSKNAIMRCKIPF